MELHALYNVSSHIDVLKHDTSKPCECALERGGEGGLAGMY